MNGGERSVGKEKNDLGTLFPDIARQWHPTLNGNLRPNQIAAHSNRKVYWLCDKGHSFDASPDKRVRGDGCPYCSNRKLLAGYNDLETTFPAIAKEWDYEKNEGAPKDYTYRSSYSAHWKCSSCGRKWQSKIRDRTASKYQTCPDCTAAKRGEERHKRYLQKRGGITDPFLIKEWDYEKNKNGPEEYAPKSNEEVYWICSKCGYRFKAKINNRAIRKSCACCERKVVVQGINDLATTHPELAAEWHPTQNGDLKPGDVLYGSARKVWWLCPEGHAYQASLLHRSRGTNCPICHSGRQTSFAEQAVFYYVKKVFPDAVSRYKDIFSNSMELDIFIPSIKFAIEYDGKAWHKSGTLKREIKKYKICQKNGIKLLRLKEKRADSDRYTADEILGIEGNMYEPKQLEQVIRFLLDKLDLETAMWTRKKPVFHSRVDIDIKRDEAEIRSYMTKLNRESFAEEYPDLAKEWHPFKNGEMTPEMVTPHSDISVWWVCPDCGNEYQASVGHRSYGTGCRKCGRRKTMQANKKRVAMIDVATQATISTFDSISEAAKKMKTNSSNISMVCRGQRKKAGGFGWKYV